MKKFISLILIASSLAVSSQAFYLDASVGYLVDSKDSYLAIRGGSVVKSSTSLAHSVEVELGYTREKDGGFEGTIVPLMLNYRADFPGSGNFSPFLGFGAGAARVKLKAFGLRDSDTVFAAQAFAGVGYKVSETVSLKLAARYIWLGDVELFGISAGLGDDVSLELGLSVKF